MPVPFVIRLCVGSNQNQNQIKSNQIIRKWGDKGGGDGEFRLPTGLAVGICNGMKKSIVTEVRRIPEFNGIGYCHWPPDVLDIAITYVGDKCIYVADCHNNRTYRYLIVMV